ncbi:protein phosphatase 2C domain-containing protein, partial [candidate division KSB1 bacterium]|nr:protein phosphatase 2C domain-containing protein [candidate division KSB1 bacterium]
MRKANEDSHYVSPDKNLIIVCDGMGGQIAGGLASKLAVETIKDIFMNLDEGQLGKLFLDLDSNLSLTSRKLVAAVRLANRRIYKMATRFAKLRGMGTTVIALSFDDNFATMAHVGDSRIFRVSDGAILQLTEDHSWLNELIEDKEIEENEIDRFAQKNVITRALGTHSAVKVDVHCEKYKKDDIYILSTDGLHNSIKQEEIRSVVLRSKLPLAAMAEKLTEKAKRRDGSDNITVAIAKVNEDSGDTEMTGVSTTVIEEDYRVLAGEDKFLMQRYTDSKVQLDPNYRSAARSRRNLMIAGTLALVIVAGLLMLVALWGWDWKQTLLLVIPGAVFFVQFAGLAAGKPGEYGRFTIFPSAILCILLSAGLFRFMASKWYQGTLYSLAAATALAWPTLAYLESLHLAGTDADSRYRLADQLANQGAAGFSLRDAAEAEAAADAATSSNSLAGAIGILREPAPYNFPPVDFASTLIVHLPKVIAQWPRDRAGWPDRLIVPLNGTEGVDVNAILADGYYALPPGARLPEDRSPITWAILAFALWGVLNTLPYLDTYGVLALRDAVVWAYAAFALTVAAALLRTGLIERTLTWYGRWLPWFLIWTPIALLTSTLFRDNIPVVPGSDIGMLTLKAGDFGVHLAGAAAFLALGLHRWFPWRRGASLRLREGAWWLF